MTSFVYRGRKAINQTNTNLDAYRYVHQGHISVPRFKPEDQWSCKRSPDIWVKQKHKTTKTWKNMKGFDQQ